MLQSHAWWQSGVVYQVYPRSFMDSNRDGIGDLAGVTQRLDYLQWLGIDAVWLSPIYPSPMADFGYDISNFTDIEPLFGSLADFDHLLEQVHARGMKLIMDFVPCHSSDEHPWFVESRSSRSNAKRDWYIWKDPTPDGEPPNNWLSIFGGSAWEYDEQTQQYYLHSFDVKQADLNWRNPEVRQAMYAAMRFWLDRGIDGFRVDVIGMMIKDDQFRDNPMTPGWTPSDPPMNSQIRLYTENQPEVHEIVREMRALIDAYNGERVLLGEIYLDVPGTMEFYGSNLDEAHLPFNFQLITSAKWSDQLLRDSVNPYELALPEGAWPNWVLSNHDNARVASRVGAEQARIAQMLLLTLRGTPTCYYADELGLADVPVPLELRTDPQGRFGPEFSRDPERTPMQWDVGTNAGFSAPGVTPWLPLSADYQVRNVEEERKDPHSFLSLTHTLLHIRREHPALSVGSYQPIEAVPEGCFAYIRQHENQRFLIVLNCGGEDLEVQLPQLGTGRIVISTHLDREDHLDLTQFSLPANEGYVIQLTDETQA